MKLSKNYTILIAFLFLLSCKDEKNNVVSNQYLLDSLQTLYIKIDSLSKTNISGGGEMDYWQVYSPEQEKLKSFGIEDPRIFISNNLSQQTQLITNKAVLGGTMSFTRISLLGEHWAIASFEDGHIGGDLLLTYSVKDTLINWKVLDAHLND